MDWLAFAKAPKMDFLYMTPEGKNDLSLQEVTEILNQMLKEAVESKNYSVIDCLLYRMDCKRMKVITMTAVLRTCWPVREKLRDFKGACTKVRINVSLRGLDPAPVLRGLT